MGIADRSRTARKNPTFHMKTGYLNHGSPGVSYPELFRVYHNVRMLPLKGGFGVLLAA